jgi:hypothetical protein
MVRVMQNGHLRMWCSFATGVAASCYDISDGLGHLSNHQIAHVTLNLIHILFRLPTQY